jgi:hypothetical protein
MDAEASWAGKRQTHIHEPDSKEQDAAKAGSNLFGWLTGFLKLIIADLPDSATKGL